LAVAGVALIVLAIAPLASTVVQRWSERDVELRSRLIFNSIRDQVGLGLATAAGANLVPFFERLAEDERLLALGFCEAGGRLTHATRRMPKNFACARFGLAKGDSFATIYDDGHRLLAGAFPLTAGSVRGHLVILHDLRFVDERVAAARFYAAIALIGMIVGIGLITVALVLPLLRGWSQMVQSAITDARRGDAGAERGETLPIAPEVQSLLRDMRSDRQDGDGLQIQWSPQTLHRLLEERLPGAEVLAVSNREPYIHNVHNGSVALQIPASGLVAALEPVMRACGGTWVAHGQRQRRPRDRRRPRPHPRSSRRSRLHPAPRLAHR
jgi:trehalose 6-phosphate synthase